MTKPFGVIALYIILGAVFTLVAYRLVLGGSFGAASVERSVDGLIIFISIALNTALAFAAAGVVASVLAHSRVPFIPVLVASAVVAGVIGLLMSFWFTGVSILFPIVMAVGGALCAIAAQFLGWLQPAPKGP
ncbi:MAG: hypothetical protein IT539_08265 [Bradyrhizobiaceae bacterium]|nr:hypothetical protein [Bradyrhizobiaceae bacterium]